MNYGIPYMGSKSKICDKICPLFPRAKNFYDLFGGGFSITHFMLKHRSNHFQNFHFNEIRPGVCDLIKDAIAGKYSYENFKPPWVSREEFFRRKEHDPYVKIVWSFGNYGKTYLFGEGIEQLKKSMHMAVVFNEFNQKAREIFGVDKFADGFSVTDRRLYLRSRMKLLNPKMRPTDLQRLQQLQQLERLERLEQLERLERLYFYSTSYENVPIEKDSVIYCDIPYKGTADYDDNKTFDRKKFLDWAYEMTEPVFISEYNVEDDRFKCIANFKKRSMLSNTKDVTLIKTEKVYANRAAYSALMQRKSTS